MFHLLAKYEDNQKLNRLLSTFYSRVSNEVTVKHFFMALSLEKMLSDLDRFNQFNKLINLINTFIIIKWIYPPLKIMIFHL